MLPRGSIIGMLGGGQLGRMSAIAAARLGYRTWVFKPQPRRPLRPSLLARNRGRLR